MTLKTEIDQIAADAGILHSIVQGPVANVTTEGGPVKSVAKAIADLEAQIVTEAGSYVDLCQDEVALATAQAQTATNQAAAAAGSALSAASVVQQDLSAIDRTFLTSITLVDVALDWDGKFCAYNGWRDRCAHTSWENETLCGNWLGSAANEAAARAISGATTGSYYFDTTAKLFYKLNAGSGITQVYRGNTRKFPAVRAVTAELGRVVIWDVTQPGCPMWMVFVSGAGRLISRNSEDAINSVSMCNGLLAVASGTLYVSYLNEINFLKDWGVGRVDTTAQYNGALIADRHAGVADRVTGVTVGIVSRYVKSVAATILPNAPVDVATGQPIPTIAVGTANGVSVIKHDGTVSSISPGGGYIAVADLVWRGVDLYLSCGSADGLQGEYFVLPPPFTTRATVVGGVGYSSTAPQRNTNYIEASSRTNYGIALGGRDQTTVLLGGLDLIALTPGASTNALFAKITRNFATGWQIKSPRGTWLADTVAETLTGAELVGNGTFAADVAGYSNYGTGTITWDAAQKARIDNAGSAWGGSGVAITTVVGKSYVASVTFDKSTGGVANCQLVAGTALGGSNLGYDANNTTATGTLFFTFIATTTTTYLTMELGTTSAWLYIDNLSCRAADLDRSIYGKGLQIFGSLTKAAVASGASLVGYSGFSVANYLQQPYSSSLDLGTAAFAFPLAVKEAANSVDEVLFERAYYTGGAYSGARVRAEVLAAGTVKATFSDGTNAATITTTAAIDDATWKVGLFIGYDGTNFRITSGGTDLATPVARGSVGSLTNTNAVLRVGLGVDGASPLTNGTLALLKPGASWPSAEQQMFISATELAMFQVNAQCCLASTVNNTVAGRMSYDESTGLLHVPQAWGRSTFRDLVRVASEATPVGSLVGIASGLGIVIQGGASGADIYVPAFLLREELAREPDQMAHYGQNLIAHDFTATASQTTFTLPVGWEIVATYQQGALKRETTSWSRSFDGFKWSVVLGTGATVSDWISILAKRV